MTPAEKQAAYRARQSEKLARREMALEAIVAEMADAKGDKGRKILALATEGLK